MAGSSAHIRRTESAPKIKRLRRLGGAFWFWVGGRILHSTYDEWVVQLKQKPLPSHIGIIPDGNGRWAARRMMPRPFGHKAGVETLNGVLNAATDLGVRAITFYAFSTENWRRSPSEVSALFALLIEYLENGLSELVSLGIRVRVIGGRERLSKAVLRAIERAETQTAALDAMDLLIAFDYGGRTEILDAAIALAGAVESGRLRADEIDEARFESMLYTSGMPDLDLIIRTSGENRVSNFLLWQGAYAEFVSSPVLWPDFGWKEFFGCIEQYQQRDRRFGGSTGVSVTP